MTRDRFLALAVLMIAMIGLGINVWKANFHSKSSSDKRNQNKSSFASKLMESDSEPKLLALKVDGVIMDGSQESFLGSNENSAVFVRKQLQKALKDTAVKGILLRVNSPGGTVGISQEIYNLLIKLRKDKLIVVSMGDVAASGGYYIASASDIIFANPGTLTGSIGVISQNFNYEGLMQKLGIKDSTVKAGKYKDLFSSTRPTTAEEKEIMEALLQDTYDQFVEDVYRGRLLDDLERGKLLNEFGEYRKNLRRETIEENAEGMIFTGRQAYDQGMVDKLGGYYDALNTLQKLVQKRSAGAIKEDLPVVSSLGDNETLYQIFSYFDNQEAHFNWRGLLGLLSGMPQQTSKANDLLSNSWQSIPVLAISPLFL